MKHVIIATIGSSGDVLPFISLGQELRGRGHRVTVVTNAHFEGDARNRGLEFRAVGSEADHSRVMQDSALFNWKTYTVQQLATHFGPTVRPLFDAVAELHEPGRSVLLAHECPWSGAWIAADRHSIPMAVAVLAPSRFPSRYDPPHPPRPIPPLARWLMRTPSRRYALDTALRVRRRLRNLTAGSQVSPTAGTADPFLAEANRVRADVGLPPLRDYAEAWSRQPSAILCLWPDWFAGRQRDWSPHARTVGFAVPRADRSVEPPIGRRAIVFTTGSVAGRQDEFFAAAAEACQQLGCDGILVTPHLDHLPATLPPGVSHVAHSDFAELFANAAAVVHHGGIGTIALALRAGIPQIIRPIMGEQFDNGLRVERLGIGRMVSVSPSASVLSRQLSRVLGSKRIAKRCQYWRDRAREDGFSLALDAVERLATAPPADEPLSVCVGDR